ncbi:MAG TPA: c-type cytochrome [Thermoanaerobaculia bacterium]
MRIRSIAALALLLVPLAAASQSRPPDNGHVVELLKQIKGKEEMPAGKVFKNVTVLKDVPAARFLRIMDAGYSRSLGVGCDHCHNEDDWASDELRPKGAAREMAVMTREINDRLLKMEHLDDQESTVNCTTCHRGTLKPATTLQ